MIEVESDRAVRVAALQQQVRECFGCSLRPGKLREVTPVFGRGDPAARMVIVGEAFAPQLCFERGDAPGVEGLVHDLDIGGDSSFTTKLLATYHPAYLLRRSFRTGMQPSKHAEAACVVRTFEAARVLTLQTQREAAQKGDK